MVDKLVSPRWLHRQRLIRIRRAAMAIGLHVPNPHLFAQGLYVELRMQEVSPFHLRIGSRLGSVQ